MLDPKVLDKKIERVRKLVMKVPNLELRFEPPKESYFQGLLSRGDRRVGKLLLEAERRGESWKWLMKRTSDVLIAGVPPVDFYVSRRIGFQELLPWEVVDSLIPRSLLEREAMRAHHGEDWVQPKVDGMPDREDDFDAESAEEGISEGQVEGVRA